MTLKCILPGGSAQPTLDVQSPTDEERAVHLKATLMLATNKDAPDINNLDIPPEISGMK